MNIEALLQIFTDNSEMWLWTLLIGSPLVVVIMSGFIYNLVKEGYQLDGILVGASASAAAFFLVGGVVSLAMPDKKVEFSEAFQENFEEKYGIGFAGSFTAHKFMEAQEQTIFATSNPVIVDGEVIQVRLMKTGDTSISVFYTPENKETSPLIPLPER